MYWATLRRSRPQGLPALTLDLRVLDFSRKLLTRPARPIRSRCSTLTQTVCLIRYTTCRTTSRDREVFGLVPDCSSNGTDLVLDYCRLLRKKQPFFMIGVEVFPALGNCEGSR